MTLDIYADLFDDDLEAVATALNNTPALAEVWAKCGHGALDRPTDKLLARRVDGQLTRRLGR
jgi:hypothetical protein